MILPVEFTERTRRLLGDDFYGTFCEALRREPPVSIRINAGKTSKPLVTGVQVPWSGQGYYLSERPAFTFDPLFHAGCYYVQEASSMFVEQALRQYVSEPAVMLDLCAAPGGKSTLARSVLPEGSLLVANEVMRNRSQVLAENIVKWGNPGVIVTNNDPADFAPLTAMFDVILTDVPCSGEGMFRKDEVAVSEWSMENVTACWQRQRRILRDIWNCLKPGGLLIYSTCTFNTEENEENVAWIGRELGAEILPVEVKTEWNITGNLWDASFPVYRFLPGRTEGEGLFLAVLRKTGATGETPADTKRRKPLAAGKKGKNTPLPVFPKELKERLANAGDYTFYIEGTQAKAFPTAYVAEYERVKSCLNVLHAGITLAEQKGKDWQPAHSLAMSTVLNPDSFVRAELTYTQAVAYLRKEAVVLEPSVQRGYVLLTFCGIPLGFAKNIGNRANNLYPQEWRIRSGYVPERWTDLFGHT